MTYFDELYEAPSKERKCYVYAWFYKTIEGEWEPFYVGIGTGKRFQQKRGRSKTFNDFISIHECKAMILVNHLTYAVAREVEVRLKAGFIEHSGWIMDAEDNKEERDKRRQEGIAAMPVVDGRKVSAKTGRGFGRPRKEVEAVRLPGETVLEACRRLGISKRTWYRLVREEQRLVDVV